MRPGIIRSRPHRHSPPLADGIYLCTIAIGERLHRQMRFKNYEHLTFFKTHMGHQKFGETQQCRGVSVLQLKGEAAQFPVIILKPLYESVFTGLNQQRQQAVFLDDKVGIERREKSCKAGHRCRFNFCLVARHCGAFGFECQLQCTVVLARKVLQFWMSLHIDRFNFNNSCTRNTRNDGRIIFQSWPGACRPGPSWSDFSAVRCLSSEWPSSAPAAFPGGRRACNRRAPRTWHSRLRLECHANDKPTESCTMNCR
ncbi:MAG: hypothetical protein H6R17_1641 [Proteobacteria bacterium]|nr:hypothetical protein [Pseudomonadota bacterium]